MLFSVLPFLFFTFDYSDYILINRLQNVRKERKILITPALKMIDD